MLIGVDWAPGKKVLRTFGLSLVATGLIVGCIMGFALNAPEGGKLVGGALAAGGVLTALAPVPVARPIYVLFMAPAFLIGNVVGRVLVALFFYLLITPLGFVLRRMKGDWLGLSRGGKPTYWVAHDEPASPEDYERQF